MPQRLRACLHGGGGPQVGEVKYGGSPHLSCKRDQIKMRDHMDKRVTPPKRVISPTWGPSPPCKQALTNVNLIDHSRNTITYHNALCLSPQSKSIVFSFSSESKWPQEKLKTMLMQNFGLTNREHYGMLWYSLEWSIDCRGVGLKWREKREGSVNISFYMFIITTIESYFCKSLIVKIYLFFPLRNLLTLKR